MDIRVHKSEPNQFGAFNVILTCKHKGEEYCYTIAGVLTPIGFFTEKSWEKDKEDHIAEFKKFLLAID